MEKPQRWNANVALLIPQCHHGIDLRRSTGLPFFRLDDMLFHMKATLIIPDPIYRDLKRRAAERGETLSRLVAELLRRGLEPPLERKQLGPLRSFDMGRARVNIADREVLYEVLDAERDAHRYRRRRKD